MAKKNKTLGTICVLAAGSLWGMMSIFVNGMNDMGLKAMDVVAVRVWVSAAVMAAGMAIYNKNMLKIRLRDLWCFFGTGIVSLTMFNYCYFSNILLTSPGVAAVLLYTSPVFIMLMSAVLFKEKLTPFKVIACIMTIIGCALVGGITGEGISFAGIVLGLLSGIGYALYSIFGRIATDKGYSSLTVTVYTFIFACIGTAPFANFGKIASAVAGGNASSALWMIIGAVVITLVPYLLYTIGLEHIETSKAGVIASIEVIVAALVGRLIFSEDFTASKLAGIILVLAALVVMNIKKKNHIAQ